MSAEKRTLESNGSDMIKTQAQLDDLEESQRKLATYEENIMNWQGDSIQRLQRLETYALSPYDQDVVTRLLGELRQHTHRFQSSIDDKRLRLKKEHQATNNRLDALYHERRLLLEEASTQQEGV